MFPLKEIVTWHYIQKCTLHTHTTQPLPSFSLPLSLSLFTHILPDHSGGYIASIKLVSTRNLIQSQQSPLEQVHGRNC